MTKETKARRVARETAENLAYRAEEKYKADVRYAALSKLSAEEKELLVL